MFTLLAGKVLRCSLKTKAQLTTEGLFSHVAVNVDKGLSEDWTAPNSPSDTETEKHTNWANPQNKVANKHRDTRHSAEAFFSVTSCFLHHVASWLGPLPLLLHRRHSYFPITLLPEASGKETSCVFVCECARACLISFQGF